MNLVLKFLFLLQNNYSNVSNLNTKQVVGKIVHVETWLIVE